MNVILLLLLNLLNYGAQTGVVAYYRNVKYNTKISNGYECYRPCLDEAPRKICYYKFILENYMSNGHACKSCYPGPENQFLNNCQCVRGDGFERAIKTVNRMIPGPSIQVCLGDKVVIDLENRLEGEETTVHWHGVLQRGTQYYDGVPFVTQCPISQGQTFRYQWIAAKGGTHFWHSHSGLQKMDGVYGSIIIREPPSKEVHRYLYDTDSYEHVIIISDWMHELAAEHFPGRLVNLTGQIPATFLINGKGQLNDFREPVEVFKVLPNRKYRFRLINAFGSVCPARITVQSHKLTVIAADGDPVEPVVVDSITSFTGERYDFIINTNRRPSSYWITLQGLGECDEAMIQQRAVLQYRGTDYRALLNFIPSFNKPLPAGVILNPFDEFCNDQNPDLICVSKLKNIRPIDAELLRQDPDYKIYLSFQFQNFQPKVLFDSNNFFTSFLVPADGTPTRSLINNISSIFPSSPLISQYYDIPQNQICNFMTQYEQNSGRTYNCTHVIKIPLKARVEIIIVDEVQVPNLSHPFHLHGNSFYVLGMDVVPPLPRKGKVTAEHIMMLDRYNRLKRNFYQPPLKDTLAVPRSGYIVVRFRADNPGFWLLHCHFQFHIVIGMNLILQVGDQYHLPPIPPNFPKCGNFLPPIY